MATIREQVIAAAVLALNTGTPVGVPTAERERGVAISETSSAVISVYPLLETVEGVGRPSNPIVRCRLTLSVSCWARGTVSQRPSQAVDPLLAWVVKALGANRYGGLAHDTRRGDLSFKYDHGENPWCQATQEMVIDYQHLVADAEART